jgi:hypothetical protein
MATESYADHALSDDMSHPVLQSALRAAYEASGDLEPSSGRWSDPLYRLIEGVLLTGEDEPDQIAVRFGALADTIGVLRQRIEAASPAATAPKP